MKIRRSATVAPGIAAAAVALLIPGTTLAQGMYAHPLAGQSPEQQALDDNSRRQWARQQTGVDPNRPPPQAQGYNAPPPAQTGFFGGGAVSEGGKATVIGGSGKWKGATGQGTFRRVSSNESSSSPTFELQVSTP